jgi:hypothetical protein
MQETTIKKHRTEIIRKEKNGEVWCKIYTLVE